MKGNAGKPTLVVMAAGIGSRYGDLKQIDPIGPGGESLMDYSVYDAKRAGFPKAVFVIRPDMDPTFRESLGPRYRKHLEVAFVHQKMEGAPPGRQKPWGTGHALLSAREEVCGPFALVTADDFYGHHSFQVMADYLLSASMKDPKNYAMVGYCLSHTLSEFGYVSRGVCEHGGTMELESIVERVHIERTEKGIHYLDETGKPHPLTGNETVSMNFWGFQPSIFAHLEAFFAGFLRERGHDPKAEFFVPTVVDLLIRAGKARVKVLPTEDSWFGMSYREDKSTAVQRIRELVDRGIYPPKLW